MKRRMCLLLLGCVCFMSACSSSTNTSEDTSADDSTAKVTAIQQDDEDTAADAEEQSDEVYLELEDFTDTAPYYVMRFHKIDGSTGEQLDFEGDAEEVDQPKAPNVSVSPEDGLGELIYSFDGEEDSADTILLALWNRSGLDSVVITIDNLDYELVFSEEETTIVDLSDVISFDDYETTIDECVLYPSAIMLKLSDVSEEEWDRLYLLESAEQKDEMISPRNIYDSDTQTMDLLYLFEDGVPSSELTLKIQKSSSSGGEKEYFDYLLRTE